MDLMQQKDEAVIKCKEMVIRTRKLWKEDKLRDEQRIEKLENELNKMKKMKKFELNHKDLIDGVMC